VDKGPRRIENCLARELVSNSAVTAKSVLDAKLQKVLRRGKHIPFSPASQWSSAVLPVVEPLTQDSEHISDFSEGHKTIILWRSLL
jgi:hypothetical protein